MKDNITISRFWFHKVQEIVEEMTKEKVEKRIKEL